VSSRTARAIQRNPASENKIKQTKKQTNKQRTKTKTEKKNKSSRTAKATQEKPCLGKTKQYRIKLKFIYSFILFVF
jgi:hypothetical protein